MSSNNNQSQTLLLQRLADGQFHSGQQIGEELGLSRAAISKQIKGLGELGLDIYRVTGKGYRLSKPLDLLQSSKILAHCKHIEAHQLHVVNVIDSTNQFLKDFQQPMSNGVVCIAEAQTAGRGRRGRTWVSPYGSSIYMSMYWSFSGGYQAISGLSLVVGIATVHALQKMGVHGARLKWPNDIYLNEKKLAGILVEVEGQLAENCDCVIGVGVNIDLPQEQNAIDQPWTDLRAATEFNIDRNALAASMISELHQANQEFSEQGLAPFIDSWMALDNYLNKPIKLLFGSKELRGTARGINSDGALLVENEGKVNAYHGGEISVRAG